MNTDKLSHQPLRLVHNRFYRSFEGGREIDRFRGISAPIDNLDPEAWVGSTTRTAFVPKGTVFPNYGLSEVYLENNQKMYLKDLIDSDPVAFLGQKHVDRFGADSGVLVKLLDAKKQLRLQVHPTREYAKQYFNSEYGKVESWYIIGVREDTSEPPYVYLGFKEGVTREHFEQLFIKEDVAGMEACCHKVSVKVGDVFHVCAGLPHAIGSCCFMIEVQEPSDVGVNCYLPFKEEDERFRLYIEKCVGCFIYEGLSYKETLSKYKVLPEIINKTEGATETLLIGENQTPYYRLTRLDIDSSYTEANDSFFISIIQEGQGRLFADGFEMSISKGDELFIPVQIKKCQWINEGPQQLKVVRAYGEK